MVKILKWSKLPFKIRLLLNKNNDCKYNQNFSNNCLFVLTFKQLIQLSDQGMKYMAHMQFP